MRALPDYLRKGMKAVVVGCCPGDRSTRVGHYYAGRGNQFWTLLYDSGIVPELLENKDDKRMLEFGIGLTDLVKRPARGVEEIERHEFAEGRIVLSQKLQEFTPRVVIFNGKITYEKFAQRACHLGLQKGKLYGGHVFVLPSTTSHIAGRGDMKLRHFRRLAAFLRGLPDERVVEKDDLETIRG